MRKEGKHKAKCYQALDFKMSSFMEPWLFVQVVQSFNVKYFGLFFICHMRSHTTALVCSAWTLKVVWHFWKKQSGFHGVPTMSITIFVFHAGYQMCPWLLA